MSLSTADRDRLIDAYLDGNLDPSEGEQLETLLAKDPEARATLRRRAMIDEHLTDLAQSLPISAWKEAEADGQGSGTGKAPIPVDSGTSKARAWGSFLPWGIAAALSALLVANRIGGEPETVPEESAFVGLLVNEAEAEFAEGAGPDEVRFDAGHYRLTSGIIHVRFENGADLVMEAPAAFRIDDAFHLALEEGGLRAIVPPTAEGFTVATPGVNYEDLGTEFGVSVDPDSGDSRLHVFDGQVDARQADNAELLSSVMAGESIAYVDGTLRETATPGAGAYPEPGDIGFRRWEAQRTSLLADPGLIAYYPFEQRDPDSARELTNLVEGSEVTDGAIAEARWVTGRWPGKQALLFDRKNDQDHVELTLPGEYEELTIATWVKVERLDHELTSILDSNGWDEGALHFQVHRTGTVSTGLHSVAALREPVELRPIELGKWRHVVSVTSLPQGRISVYLDGKLASRFTIEEPGLLAPGTCRLGNWLRRPDWHQAPVRAFKGRIDELAIWNRALEESEIQSHFEAGRPNLIDE